MKNDSFHIYQRFHFSSFAHRFSSLRDPDFEDIVDLERWKFEQEMVRFVLHT